MPLSFYSILFVDLKLENVKYVKIIDNNMVLIIVNVISTGVSESVLQIAYDEIVIIINAITNVTISTQCFKNVSKMDVCVFSCVSVIKSPFVKIAHLAAMQVWRIDYFFLFLRI